jgi:PAS domain S-box-containing protein
MSAEITDLQTIGEDSLINRELYRVFVTQSSEAIWRIELDEPVSVNLPPDEQIRLYYQYAALAECNQAMARMYGFKSIEEIVGIRLGDLLIEEDQANHDYLRAFIDSNYRLEHAESHEIDRDGNPKFFLNNLIGIVENGFLVRVWGTQRDITERKEIERSKAHLAAIVEFSDDAIISKDLDGVVTSWNRGAEKMFGYRAEEIIGKSISILIPPHLIDEESRFLENIKKDRSVEHYETVRARKDGTLVAISLTVSPIKNEAGEIIGASKIARDISERKEAEENLRESQAILALSMQSSRMGAWWRDFATETVWWSEELEEIFGLEHGEFRGTEKDFFDFVHEDYREEIWNEISRAIDERREYVIEFRFRHADGSIRWLEGRGQAVYSEKGAPVRLYGIGIDITERRKSEETLRDSEERFAKAFNSSPLVLTITALKTGKLIEVNETFVRVTGYTREEAIGRSTAELGLWANAAEREEELKIVQKMGEIRDLEYRFRLKDGSEIIGLLSAELLEIGGEPCALTIIQDITERKKAEEISARYRLLSQRARDVILFVRSDGRIADANQAAVETYGYEQADLLNMRIHDLRAPETLAVLEEQLSKANESGLQWETVHLRKDGTRFPVEVTSVGAEVAGERLLISIIRDISERRQNEEIVRRSMKQMALVTDIAPVYIANCSRDMRFKFVNKAYADRFGLHPEDVVGKKIADILGQEAFEKISGYIETVLSGQKVEFEQVISYPKIGEHFMHCSYAPEFDESGEVIGWVAAITDMSERRRMEEALRESESRFRTMTNSAPMLVWMSGTDKLSAYFNQTWLDFTGRTMEQEIANGWMEGIHEDDLERCLQVFSDTYDAREGFEIEYRLRRFDGEYRWILDKGVPLFTHNGTFRGYIGSCIDVTERREGQEALLKAERRASEEYLELLSRIVPVGQTLGAARDLTSIYRALHEFVRASMPCTAFFVSFYDAARNMRTAAYVCGEEGEVDISLLPPMPLTRDGGPNSQAIFEKKSIVVSRYWDLMKSRPHVILNEDGKDPNSSLVVPMKVMNRITGTLEVQAYQNDAFTKEHIIALEMVANLAAVAIENVRLLQVEAEARETAEAANRAKDEFLSVLSHELRTPLNSMLGWTRMLRAGILDEEKTARAIEVIERNTLLQNNLIEDLLDVSRIISGKMRIEKETVDLAKIFDDAVEILRPFAAQKNIAFETETPENSLIISGDATRFQQVVVNLVQNAVKFTGEGGAIGASLSRNGNFARLVVTDNGIGIGEELLPFIFDRFRQADSSTKRAYSGLGLGLTIVRNLVELHGGTIQAESAGRGQGATFTVEIPLTEEFLDKTSAKTQNPQLFTENAALAGARILLVDDDAESLVPLQIFLEKEKAEIHTATSAKEALEKLGAQDFHVLITDIGMPIADGYDLIARVRQLQTEQNAFITAIALTAYASSDDRRRALAAGFQGHLAKPVDFDELLSVIKSFYDKMN